MPNFSQVRLSTLLKPIHFSGLLELCFGQFAKFHKHHLIWFGPGIFTELFFATIFYAAFPFTCTPAHFSSRVNVAA